MNKSVHGIPFVISGPSGAGKTTLYKLVLDFFPGIRHSVSYTTREPRQGEVDGKDYWFVDDATFDSMIKGGEFLEHADVHGRRYGTSKKALDSMLERGVDVILEIDVQGAIEVMKKLEDASYIFILPPSIEACAERMKARGKDTPEEIERRVKVAEREIKQVSIYEHIIINEDLDTAFEELKAVITAEKSKKGRVAEEVKDRFGVDVK